MGISDPAVLGERDEVEGRHDTALGMPPAHQRLHGDDLLGARRRRRAGTRGRTDRSARARSQLGVQGEPVGQLGVHARVEELPAVAALVGGPAHGGVGVAAAAPRRSRRRWGRWPRPCSGSRKRSCRADRRAALPTAARMPLTAAVGLGRPGRPRQQGGERAAAEVRDRVLGPPGARAAAGRAPRAARRHPRARERSRRCRSGRRGRRRPRRPGACAAACLSAWPVRSSRSVASARPVTGSWSHRPAGIGRCCLRASRSCRPLVGLLDYSAHVRPRHRQSSPSTPAGPATATAEAPGGFGYTTSVMTTNASEALVHLDELRERLKEASGRLGWLRSYL